MKPNENSFEVPVNFHQGKMLARAAKNYGTLAAAAEEGDQNAIDAGATRILNEINLSKRFYRISDNGTGASREKIAEAFSSVGETLKSKEKFGQFGLGFFATMPIAGEFDFTTCPESRTGNYTRYTFITSEIVKQKSIVIVGTPLNLTHNPDGEVWWRSQLYARKLIKDHRKMTVTGEEIAEILSLKFGEAILKRKIKITVDFTNQDGERTVIEVQPREFTGEPLEKLTGTRKECGRVELTLFTARLVRGGRKGEITFGTFDNPSRITARQFYACTLGLLKGTVAKALMTGIFEGVMLCENIVLHEDRTRFEDNEALLEFCDMLEEWYEKVGKNIIAETSEHDADTRFQRIGIEVMPFAESLLQQAQFKSVAGRFSVGSIGKGHIDVPKKKIIGPDSGPSLAVGGRPFVGKTTNEDDKDGKDRKPPKAELPEHHPGIVHGVKGRTRTKVRGGSTGLGFEYVELENFRIPFTFDAESGTLSFNMTYPSWALCQENDEFLRWYHITVLTIALELESFRDPSTGAVSDDITRFAYESVHHQAFGITNGDALMAISTEQVKKKKK